MRLSTLVATSKSFIEKFASAGRKNTQSLGRLPRTSARAVFKSGHGIAVAAVDTSLVALIEQLFAAKRIVVLAPGLSILLEFCSDPSWSSHMNIKVTKMKTFVIAMAIAVRERRVGEQRRSRAVLQMAFCSDWPA